MQYLICFLEGIITFISPCLLPMLPVYLSYFAGGSTQRTTKRTVQGALGFCLGFTIVFVLMGALAGTLGFFVKQHQTAVNLVTGGIVVLLGLHFWGLISLRGLRGIQHEVRALGFGTSVLFGLVFSIGWTPCVGAFLGSALLLASQQASAREGIVMLLCYSVGLSVPFLLSAVLLDQLQHTFTWVKQHYTVVNRVCGTLLVLVGVLMMSGYLGRWMSAWSV